MVQRLPGPPGQHPLPRRRAEGHADRAHAQRLGARRAAGVGGDRRELPPARRLGRRARGAAPVHARRRADHCGDERSGVAARRLRDGRSRRRRRRRQPDRAVAALVRPGVGGAAVSNRMRSCCRRSTPTGWPQSRYLLARGADERGFSFFTNYESAKSAQLDGRTAGGDAVHLAAAAPPGACRRRGRAAARGRERRVLRDRGRGRRRSGRGRRRSRRCCPIGQSLEQRVAQFEETFADVDEVPRPAYWGGWLLRPVIVRVLAGSAQPPARSCSLSPRRRRRRVDHRAVGSVAHIAAASTRPSISAAIGGTIMAVIPVGPDRAGAADARRQLDLHALLRRQVHRVVGMQAAEVLAGCGRGR